MEKRLRQCTMEGARLDLRTGRPEDDDPARGAKWPDKRTIDAGVIVSVATTPPGAGETMKKLEIHGARINGSLDFFGARIQTPVLLVDCYVAEQLILVEATAPSLRLNGCRLERGASFDNAQIRGNLTMKNGFKANGEVRLLGADIGGNLELTGGHFNNPENNALAADGATIKGSVFCCEGFEAEGEVRLLGADIGGILDLTGGRFSNPENDALSADRATIKGSVFCCEGFEAEGNVRLLNAEIGGILALTGGHFSNLGNDALSADRATIKGSVFCCEGFEAEGKVRLLGADIGGNLELTGGHFSNTRERGHAICAEGMSVSGTFFFLPSDPVEGMVDLINAHVRHLVDSPNAWAGKYELSGFRYERLGAPESGNRTSWKRNDRPVKDRLEWLSGNESGYIPQAYDHLADVYRRQGDDTRCRRVLIAKQRKRRPHLSPPRRIWSYVEGGLIGFGYRTWLALIWFAALLAAGTIFFESRSADLSQRIPTQAVAHFQPFAYTLDLLLPVVNLGYREAWVATSYTQTVHSILIVAGWVLTTAIVASLTGLVRRSD